MGTTKTAGKTTRKPAAKKKPAKRKQDIVKEYIAYKGEDYPS